MRKVIYVLSHGDKWKVKCDHCEEDIVDTQREAIAIAKGHVGDLGPGAISQILVQGDGGRFRTEWTYGEDPYPPAG